MLAQILLVEGWMLLLMEHTFMSQLGDMNENTDKPLNSGVKVIDAATNTVKKKIKLLGEPSSMGKFIGGPQYHMTVAASGSGKVITKKLNGHRLRRRWQQMRGRLLCEQESSTPGLPDEGFVFTGWSGGACTKKSKNCTLVIKDDYSVTATFGPK